MKQKFDITGMTCSACSSRVEKCVGKLNGIRHSSVNLLTNSMQVEYDEGILNDEIIIQAVQEAGYGAFVQKQEKKQDIGKTANKEHTVEKQLADMKQRLILSFAFLIPLMYVSMGHMAGLPMPAFLSGHENAVGFALTQFLLCLPILYVNRSYFSRGFRSFLHGAPNMDSLIAIGSSAALVYGIFAIYRMGYGLGVMDVELVARYHMDLYFESAAMILALITLGKYLETKSKGKTSEAITKLMDLSPKTAVVERNGEETEIPVEDVVIGDIVIVRPGQSIPVDGIIIEGSTTVDESAITGESIPVEKGADSSVIAATINKSGFLKFRAVKVGDDTTFAQIIRLVEEASSSKAPIAKLADKIAGIFVPVVIAIAVIAAVVWLLLGASFEFVLSTAICILVISCPCALGLATPVAIMVGTGKGAENGILIKSGEALETAHAVDYVVMDKTGTITQGKPQVTDVETFGMEEEALLRIAGSMEQKSAHPLAEAVVSYTKEKGTENVTVESFTSVTGKGILAEIDNKTYMAGNERFLQENGVDLKPVSARIDQLAAEGKTPLIFAQEKKLVGIIAVADVVKPTSKEAIEKLKALGIKVIMLTGDNKKTAEAIRSQLGLDTVIAEVLPHEKENEIARLQKNGKTVAMIGDGVNDAPALARADVGLAIGAGTDVAIESADIVLMKNDLLDAVTAIKLSKAVIRNIKQNLFWAFFYNSIGIPLAAGVFYPLLNWKLNPMFGAAAMSLSSICVVSNALRLKLFKPDREKYAIMNKENETAFSEQSEVKEEKNMITVKIEGMMCAHCTGSVEKALNALEGVEAKVSLEDKAAYVTSDAVTDAVLIKAVTNAGYEVVEILR